MTAGAAAVTAPGAVEEEKVEDEAWEGLALPLPRLRRGSLAERREARAARRAQKAQKAKPAGGASYGGTMWL
jgi:hypothetical protein